MKTNNIKTKIIILKENYNELILILENLFYLLNNTKIIENKKISYSFYIFLNQYWYLIQNDKLINLLKEIKKIDILEFSFLKIDFYKKENEWNNNLKNINFSKKNIFLMVKNLKVDKYNENKKLIKLWEKEIINLNIKS